MPDPLYSNYPENCVVCFKELISPQGNWLISLDSELRIYFLLRKIFRLGEHELLSFFLRDSGNPSQWVGLCGGCHGLVEDGRRLFREIAALEAQLGRTKRRLRATVRASWKEGEEDGCGSLTEVARKAVIVQNEDEGSEENGLFLSGVKEEEEDDIDPVKLEPSSPSPADWIEEDAEESVEFGFEIHPEEEEMGGFGDCHKKAPGDEVESSDEVGVRCRARLRRAKKASARVPDEKKEELLSYAGPVEREDDDVSGEDEDERKSKRLSAMDYCTLLKDEDNSLLKCNECGKTFNLRNSFRVHLNKTHGIYFNSVSNKARHVPQLHPERDQSALDHDTPDEDSQGIRHSARITRTRSRKASEIVVTEEDEVSEDSEDEINVETEYEDESESEDDEFESSEDSEDGEKAFENDEDKDKRKPKRHSPLDYCTLLKEENESLFKCKECEKTFILRSSFRIHLNRIHGIFFNAIKRSRKNEKQFVKPKKQRSHSALDYCTYIEDGDESIYSCNECKKKFRLLPSFRVHLNQAHRIHIQQTSLDYITFLEDKKVFKCKECGKELEKRDSMRVHLNNSHGLFFKPSKLAEMNTVPKSDQKPLDYCEVKEDFGRQLYKCVKCQKEFKLMEGFVKHLTQEHDIYFVGKRNKKIFKGMRMKANVDEESTCQHEGKDTCPEKGRRFSSSYALENHSRLFHQYLETVEKKHKNVGFDFVQLVSKVGPLRRWKCQKSCKVWFATEEERSKHEAEEHPEQKEEPEGPTYSCKSCDATYRDKWDLVIHLEQLHEGEGLQDLLGKTKDLHVCTECPSKYSRPQGLEFHMALRHEKLANKKKSTVVAVCTICGYGIKSSNHVAKHMNYHTGDRPYMCEACGDTFTEEKYLHSHLALQHADAELAKLDSAVQNRIKNHTCPTCNRKFSQPAALRVHIKTQHEGQYRYRCPVCNVGMEFPNYLKRHMLIHTKEKPHKCAYADCDASFRTGASLTMHVRSKHTFDLPFPCKDPGCGKAFPCGADRDRHFEAVHKKEVKFTCHLCGKGFPIRDYYRGHMKRIHGCYEPPSCPAKAAGN